MGNKSSNSYLDRQVSSKWGKAAGGEFDALYIPRIVIAVAAGVAAGVFAGVLVLSLEQHSEKPPHLQGTCIRSLCCTILLPQVV